MNNPRILFWHRKDLRTNNNQTLQDAFLISKAITAIYIFDKNYAFDFNAKPRAWFLANSLKELSQKWEDIGSRLIIEEGNPNLLIPYIAKLTNSKFVAWNKSIEPYEIKRDNEIKKILGKYNIKVIDAWDQLLIDPSLISTGNKKPYTVYGPFYKNLKDKLNHFKFNKIYSNQFEINTNLKDLEEEILETDVIRSSPKKLDYFLKISNFTGKNICPCIPGEKGAEILLNNFISSNKLLSYKKLRDFPYQDGTSFLSASIRFGTISLKKIWGKTLELNLKECNSEELLSVETWQKEIIWREFYQHSLFHFPELANGPFRKKWASFPWQNNNEWFIRWSEGDTGIPIIDAAMRQINQCGWMHNRCRMIVASFLVKDLICNWQMGEEKFMELLVDGDLAANNGGWQWSASSGMDPKPLRIFNPHTQTIKFDPLCKYIKYWIPELLNVPNEEIIKGEITKLNCLNYPSPIVKHNIQQRLFKTIYAEI